MECARRCHTTSPGVYGITQQRVHAGPQDSGHRRPLPQSVPSNQQRRTPPHHAPPHLARQFGDWSKQAGEYGVLANGDIRPIIHDLLNHYVDPAIGTDDDAYVIRCKALNTNEMTKSSSVSVTGTHTRHLCPSQQIYTHGTRPR